jgi:hypothetical protein
MWPPSPALPDPQIGNSCPKGLSTGYRLLIGLGGALVGAIVGLGIALLAAVAGAGGNTLAEGFGLMGTAPVGLLLGMILGAVLALRVLRYLQRDDLGTTARRKKTSLAFALVVGIPALIVGTFHAAMHYDDPPPDRELIANFRQHQGEFEQLAKMLQTDKALTRVDQDWTDPNSPQSIGVSQSRIDEYRRLLRDVKTPRGFQTPGNPNDIEFYYFMTGSAISSDTDKGYAYLVTPPPHPLTNLDDCQPDEKNGITAYRHIQGNWYLFYEYIPG